MTLILIAFVLFAIFSAMRGSGPGGGGAQLPAQRLCWSDLHSLWRLVVLGFIRSGRRRILRRRRVVRRRRFFGQLVMTLSDADRARIIEAIRQAETRTSGEIYCVFTRASSGYRVFPLAWAAVVALLMPLPLIYLTAWPAGVIYALQLAVFLGALYGLTRERIRYWIVPRRTKRERAHQEALRQFAAHGLQHTQLRTGVLIFVSIAERYAEVLADAGIDQKVSPDVWDDVVATLTSAFASGQRGRRPRQRDREMRIGPGAALPGRCDQSRRASQRDCRALILGELAIASFVQIAIGWPLCRPSPTGGARAASRTREQSLGDRRQFVETSLDALARRVELRVRAAIVHGARFEDRHQVVHGVADCAPSGESRPAPSRGACARRARPAARSRGSVRAAARSVCVVGNDAAGGGDHRAAIRRYHARSAQSRS